MISKLDRTVEAIVLTNNNVGDVGAKALGKAIEGCGRGNVQELSLQMNKVCTAEGGATLTLNLTLT